VTDFTARRGWGGDTGPAMETLDVPPTEGPSDTGWEARPTPAGRWGIVYRPTGHWVAFGGEAQCRELAAYLTETNATLRPPAPAGGHPRGPGA
jgi:hypothetical protein